MDEQETAIETTGVETQVETQVEELEPESIVSANEGQETEEVELEDLEVDGELFKVHPKIKKGYVQEAAYTRKSQALAAERKEHDAAVQRFQMQAQFLQERASDEANLRAIDQDLQKFSQLDWAQLNQQDGQQAQALWMMYQQRRDERSKAQEELQRKDQERGFKIQQEYAKSLEQAHSKLAELIPNWGPEVQSQLVKAGTEHYGYRPEELQHVTDPRAIRMLNDAAKWQKHLASQKAKQSQSANVEPTKKVKARGTVMDPLDNRLSMKEWAANRLKQMGSNP